MICCGSSIYLKNQFGLGYNITFSKKGNEVNSGPIIDTVKKTNRAVVVEQGWATCGVTAELSALIMEEAFDRLDAPVKRIAGADVPMPYAANLEQLATVQVADIVRAAKDVCYRE